MDRAAVEESRLLDWPDYLSDASAEQMATMVRRIDLLVARLELPGCGPA